MLNELVKVSYFRQLREQGVALAYAVRRGPERQLRPVLMTATIAAFGLVPLLFASGPSFNEFDVTVTRPFRLPGKAALDGQIGDFGITAAANNAEDAKYQAALTLNQLYWDWMTASAEARVDRQAHEAFRIEAAARCDAWRALTRFRIDSHRI